MKKILFSTPIVFWLAVARALASGGLLDSAGHPHLSGATIDTLTVPGSAFSVGGSTLVTSGGNIGVGTAAPGARLDVAGDSALRGATTVVGSMTVTAGGAFGGNLNMSGFQINNVSTITTYGENIVVSPYSPSRNYTYAISIGSGAYANDTYAVGIGVGAGNNSYYGVGVGFWANDNYTSGVGVGRAANSNHSYGVGMGSGAHDNFNSGVGVGTEANFNNDYGVGIGAYSQNNAYYATGVGAYSSAKSSSVALGYYAKALNVEAVALGAGANANAARSVCIGAYCVNNSTNTVKIKEGYTLKVDSITLGTTGSVKGVIGFAGNTSGLVTLQPQAAAGTYTLSLPTTTGNAGQFLRTDGTGVLTWAGNGASQLEQVDGASAITTISTVWVDMNGMTKTVTCAAGDNIQAWAYVTCSNTGGYDTSIRLMINGTVVATSGHEGTNTGSVSLQGIKKAVAAGARIIKLQWKTGNAAGAATAIYSTDYGSRGLTIRVN